MYKIISLLILSIINFSYSKEFGAYFNKIECDNRDIVAMVQDIQLDNYKPVTMGVDSVIITCDSVHISMVQLNISIYCPIKLSFAINQLDSSVVRMVSDSARWAKWPFLADYHPIELRDPSAQNKLINYQGELVGVLYERNYSEGTKSNTVIIKPGVEYTKLKELLKQCNLIMNNNLQIAYPKEETGEKVEHYGLGKRIIQFTYTLNDRTKTWNLFEIHEVFWMEANKSREKIFVKLDKLKLFVDSY